MNVINFAFLGCGKIAERHIEAIQAVPNARLIAVCDADSERAKNKAALGQVAYYLSYDEMLKHHPDIHVITIMTPSGVHYEQGMDIIQHYQKHLLIEKPFVLTTKQAQELKTVADHHGVNIYPIYQHRFNKAVQRVKQAINLRAELGTLRVGTVRVRWCRPQRYYDLNAWRGTWAMDGGALTNQGIHFIDLLRYLCGEVKRVHAKLGTFGANIEVEDTGVAILEFTSGALGIIEIMTSARPDDFEASISCVCENGLAVISGIASNELQIFTPDPAQIEICSEKLASTYGYGHNTIIHGVVDSLLKNEPPAIQFADGLQTIQLLHAFYRSDELDGWVNVNDAGDSARLGCKPASSAHALVKEQCKAAV
jgi:UDP-N-acetyl-2-amino-2-deoxyglucuronate dehydrogenase